MRKLTSTLSLLMLCACSMLAQGTMSADWKRIEPRDWEAKPINLIANEWMALATGTDEKKMNSMTIAWGTFGQLWNKPVVIVYVSSSRYSKHLMDKNDYFTVTAFPQTEQCRQALMYIGTHSQRDEPDKTRRAGLTTEWTPTGNPVFSEGNLAIECKKIYADEFKADLLPSDVKERLYGGGRMGLHTFYIGEITNIWKK